MFKLQIYYFEFIGFRQLLTDKCYDRDCLAYSKVQFYNLKEREKESGILGEFWILLLNILRF